MPSSAVTCSFSTFQPLTVKQVTKLVTASNKSCDVEKNALLDPEKLKKLLACLKSCNWVPEELAYGVYASRIISFPGLVIITMILRETHFM